MEDAQTPKPLHKSKTNPKTRSKLINPLQRAWISWLQSLPEADKAVLNAAAGVHDCAASTTLKLPYHQYANLVLINQKAFNTGLLRVIVNEDRFRDHRERLWRGIATALKVEHIGLTGPIPLYLHVHLGEDDSELTGESTCSTGPNVEARPASDSLTDPTTYTTSRLSNGTNVLRSPTSFQPLYGSFGPVNAGSLDFSPSNANSVFWARAVQHGITQTWSPQHTMFSAGNVKEKGRILNEYGSRAVGGTTVVDLYAGIGYFAFPYRRALADVVLCWEINPWSIEGFRRGAELNGWADELEIVKEDEPFDGRGRLCAEADGEAGEANRRGGPSEKRGLVMFAESNEKAWSRIRDLRNEVPFIRHVNCGYLPTSEPVWELAVKLISPSVGGWIHAHENIALKDIESRTVEVVEKFQALVDRHYESKRALRAACPNVFRLKTYAPGVMHCVLDISLSPMQPGEEPALISTPSHPDN